MVILPQVIYYRCGDLDLVNHILGGKPFNKHLSETPLVGDRVGHGCTIVTYDITVIVVPLLCNISDVNFKLTSESSGKRFGRVFIQTTCKNIAHRESKMGLTRLLIVLGGVLLL